MEYLITRVYKRWMGNRPTLFLLVVKNEIEKLTITIFRNYNGL